MASASSSAASAAFGLGRRKKNPGLLDQIGNFFGGDKKKKGKSSATSDFEKQRRSRRRSVTSHELTAKLNRIIRGSLMEMELQRR